MCLPLLLWLQILAKDLRTYYLKLYSLFRLEKKVLHIVIEETALIISSGFLVWVNATSASKAAKKYSDGAIPPWLAT